MTAIGLTPDGPLQKSAGWRMGDPVEPGPYRGALGIGPGHIEVPTGRIGLGLLDQLLVLGSFVCSADPRAPAHRCSLLWQVLVHATNRGHTVDLSAGCRFRVGVAVPSLSGRGPPAIFMPAGPVAQTPRVPASGVESGRLIQVIASVGTHWLQHLLPPAGLTEDVADSGRRSKDRSGGLVQGA
jgi:hypothetical protein